VEPVQDDRLRLIFTCCHPALSSEAQVALTLRLLGGLTTAEVARAFLVAESTMAQRLARAKRKIKAAHIRYRVPSTAELPERLRPVLAVLYLVYNAGADGPSGHELRTEAIRLTRATAGLMPDEPEVAGLLALLLLTESRQRTRFAGDGSLILLREQDRARWDRTLIEEGQTLVRSCLRRNIPGPYQVQAAINAVHADAASVESTDWGAILALYDQLLALSPTPVVALNRAIALGEVRGPVVALAVVDDLDLDGYYLFHATRADLLRRLGRAEDAAQAYARAADLAPGDRERTFLQGRLTAIGSVD
jgi:RNA polymerase sigma-70 factor (ECF subfamily)